MIESKQYEMKRKEEKNQRSINSVFNAHNLKVIQKPRVAIIGLTFGQDITASIRNQ